MPGPSGWNWDEDRCADLIARARSGSAPALEELIGTYRSYLLLVANEEIDPKLRGKVAASDVVQEACAEIVRQFGGFRGGKEPEWRAWIRQMLMHDLLDARRRFFETGKRDLAKEVPLHTSSSAGRADRADRADRAGRAGRADRADRAPQMGIEDRCGVESQLFQLPLGQSKLPPLMAAVGDGAAGVRVIRLVLTSQSSGRGSRRSECGRRESRSRFARDERAPVAWADAWAEPAVFVSCVRAEMIQTSTESYHRGYDIDGWDTNVSRSIGQRLP